MNLHLKSWKVEYGLTGVGISFITVSGVFWTVWIILTSPGHAGAMLQARQLGTELFVGIHSDDAILENKGPTVMTLEER